MVGALGHCGCLVLGLALASSLGARSAEPPLAVPAAAQVRLVEWAGRVEVLRSATHRWEIARTNLVLGPGDQIRTADGSRATLQFQDRSVFRLNQGSLLEVRATIPREDGHKSLFLRWGELFFLDRERPSRLELGTPTTTSAIRGTEFLLEAEAVGGFTRLRLLDGAVRFTALASAETADLVAGQEATVGATGHLEVRPLLVHAGLIQWCLHYPAVLDPAELAFSPVEAAALAESVRHYRNGDLRAALMALPDPGQSLTLGPSARVYLAGLRLAAGQVGSGELDLPTGGDAAASRAAAALRRLVAVTRGDVPEPGQGVSVSASEWLVASYELQARSKLAEARDAARQATALAPGLGFAWIRLAELEWSLGRVEATRVALAEGRRGAPSHPLGWVLEGFRALAVGKLAAARQAFAAGRDLDASLSEAWLGLGLVAEREGQGAEALRCFQVAVIQDPRRSVLRAYLGKGWAAAGEDALAEREFDLALAWDPGDPTGWLYRGLYRQQTHRLNASVRDLERSVAENDNRSPFRSSLLLDQDRAVRQADLALSYSAVGFDEVAARRASRAIGDDYADPSGHLYRARTLQAGEDPMGFELRDEAARQSELLIANLLSPPEGANLSQLFSEQSFYRGFEGRRVGGTSLTEYRSQGDWAESVSLYGTVDRLGYAVDGRYVSSTGDRPNGTREEGAFGVTLKQALTESDGLYLQAGWLRRSGDDPTRLWDPGAAVPGYHFTETEAPFAYLGYHREWSPAAHSLVLISQLEDRLTVEDPDPAVLFLRERSGSPVSLGLDPFFEAWSESEFRLTSAEVQQIWQTDQQTLVAGVRGQVGEVRGEERLIRDLGGTLPSAAGSPDYVGLGAYVYDTWRWGDAWRVTLGMAFDDLTYPRNASWPPTTGSEERRSQWSPKLGMEWHPWSGGAWRGAVGRGLGGQDFAQSLRLEPTELAGFTQVFRNVAPVSTAGLLTGLPQDFAGIGFDQTVGTSMHAGLTLGYLATAGDRSLGVVRNSGFIPVPDATGELGQEVSYRERSLEAYAASLLGERWAVGIRYRLTHSEGSTGFPSLPDALPGVSELAGDQDALLGQLQLFAVYHHESGFYAGWTSDAYHQQSGGTAPESAGEHFWQHQAWVGYRLPRRRADLRIGVVNLTGEDYRLYPLNPYQEPPRERAVEVRLRLHF